MTYLPDVNVWVALAAERHVHHRLATAWFDSLEDGTANFCRMTQMAFMRLVTNPRVMAEDAITPAAAWDLYDALREDARVAFSAEPAAIEEHWRALTNDRAVSPATWTDTYLMSFAHARGLRPVSFDRAFKAMPGALVLAPS